MPFIKSNSKPIEMRQGKQREQSWSRPSQIPPRIPSRFLLAFALILTVLVPFPGITRPSDFAIYGDDDRHEVFEESDTAKRALASSTVAMIERKLIRRNEEGEYNITLEKYGEFFNLCPDERYYDQGVAADCTGFLVAPDLVVTAGHCIRNNKDCRSVKFVFDFSILSSGNEPKQTSAANVFECKKVVVSRVPKSGADYAVIQLDRPAFGRAPLKLRRAGQMEVYDEVFIIGNPEGLPTKIAGGGIVRALDDKIITTNLDAYGGNSGSPVFNERTHEVEGILVTGDTDFVPSRNPNTGKICQKSYQCRNDECLGEDVTPISLVLPFLK